MKTWFPYAASDHAPFIASGTSATWISHVYIHANSRNDKIMDVNPSHMLEIVNALMRFLKK